MIDVLPPLLAKTEVGGWRWASLPSGWVLVVSAVVLYLLARALYRRERGGAGRWVRVVLAGLRALVLLAILFVLAGPYREEVRVTEERAHLVVLVDASGSMATKDRYPGRPDLDVSRIELLRRGLAPEGDALLKRLDERFVLHVFAFASDWWSLGSTEDEGDVTAIGDRIRALEAGGRAQGGTNLGTLLRNVAGEFLGRDDRRLAGVLLLSDGRDTGTDESPREVLESLGRARTDLRLTPIALGNASSGRNVRVERIRALDVVLVGDDLVVESAIRHRGFAGLEGVRARMTIDRIADADGTTVDPTPYEPPENARLEVFPLTLGGEDEPTPLLLRARLTEPGTFRITVHADLPQDVKEEDAIREDDRATHEVRVVDQRIRVLVVDNLPRHEFKFLGNWLTREPGVATTRGDQRRWYDAQLFQQTAAPTAEQGHSLGLAPLRRMPSTRREIFDYDVIVLGDVAWQTLADSTAESREVLQVIRQFVKEGGGLALIAGIDYNNPGAYADTPLEDLLPVNPRRANDLASADTSKRYRLALTDVGRRHPIFGVVPGEQGLLATPDEVAEAWSGGAWFSEEWAWWWLYRAKRGLRPGAVALAVARPEQSGDADFLDENDRPLPVFATMPYGKGRVFFSAMDTIWRLRYGLSDTVYGPFWDQIIRHLATYRLLGGNKRFKISTDKETYFVGDTAVVTIAALDRDFEPVETPALDGVHVQDPTGTVRRLEGDLRPVNATAEGAAPGTFRTLLPIRREGTWRVWITDAQAQAESRAEHRFEAEYEVPERRLTLPDHDLLDALARRADGRRIDGRVATIDQLGEIVDDLPPRTERRVLDRLERPQWDKAWVLLLLAALLGLEWAIRKRYQMI